MLQATSFLILEGYMDEPFFFIVGLEKALPAPYEIAKGSLGRVAFDSDIPPRFGSVKHCRAGEQGGTAEFWWIRFYTNQATGQSEVRFDYAQMSALREVGNCVFVVLMDEYDAFLRLCTTAGVHFIALPDPKTAPRT